jgi:hypothetical protein
MVTKTLPVIIFEKSPLRLYRESRAGLKLPWVASIIAESEDLESLQREALHRARQEGSAAGPWAWSADRLGGRWELRLDDDNSFTIKTN